MFSIVEPMGYVFLAWGVGQLILAIAKSNKNKICRTIIFILIMILMILSV